jgi:outer membrane protein TolC
MKKRSRVFLIALYVLFGFSLKSQNAVSYNDFILSIKTNYPLVKKAGNLVEQANYNYNAARGNYDPVVNSAYENKFFNSKNYFSVMHAELKQPLFTNQSINIGYDYGQGNYLDPSSVTPLQGTPFVGVEASLLQGMLFDKRRAEVLKARQYKTYYEAERDNIMNNILLEASNNYADWVYAEKELQLYEFFMQLAYKRYVAMVVLSSIGEKAAVDSIEASLLYQGRMIDYQTVKVDNQKIQNRVISFTWKNEAEPMKYDTSLTTIDSLENYFERAELLMKDELLKSELNNPILKKYESAQKILAIDKRLKAELIKPKLDVKYNFLNNGTSPYVSDFSINNYKWGAKFSMPLLLRTSRNEFKISKLNLENNQLELSNKQNEIELKVNVLKQALLLVKSQIVASEKNVSYSKQLLEAEKLKFDNGESSLFLLNTRETKWLEAELKLAQYRTKFMKLSFEMIYLKGSMNYKL